MTVREYAAAHRLPRTDKRFMQGVGQRAAELCRKKKITPLPRDRDAQRWSQAYPESVLNQVFKDVRP